MRRYLDDYGIGPWEVHESNARKAEDFREYGQPVERSWRLAIDLGVIIEIFSGTPDDRLQPDETQP
jgi:hypothetical protein